jgi:hypothetical protein
VLYVIEFQEIDLVGRLSDILRPRSRGLDNFTHLRSCERETGAVCVPDERDLVRATDVLRNDNGTNSIAPCDETVCERRLSSAEVRNR